MEPQVLLVGWLPHVALLALTRAGVLGSVRTQTPQLFPTPPHQSPTPAATRPHQHGARLGLNGPDVIESDAGIAEFDSHDRALIWSIDGGATRVAIGQADQLVVDDVAALRAATTAALNRGVPKDYRSQDLSRARHRLDAVDPASRPSPEQLAQLRKEPDR